LRDCAGCGNRTHRGENHMQQSNTKNDVAH
jgi:hypothetical protein